MSIPPDFCRSANVFVCNSWDPCAYVQFNPNGHEPVFVQCKHISVFAFDLFRTCADPAAAGEVAAAVDANVEVCGEELAVVGDDNDDEAFHDDVFAFVGLVVGEEETEIVETAADDEDAAAAAAAANDETPAVLLL